jgi:chemotaxis signal transduction protein
MITDESRAARLLCFMIPNLPELQLALALPEVLEIAPLMAVTPVPFAPSFVTGLAFWRGDPVTVIDLAAALSGSKPSSDLCSVDQQYLIALALVGEQPHTIAWAMLPGSAVREIPSPAQSIPVATAAINRDMFHATICVDGQSIGLVNTARLFSPSVASIAL